MPTPLTVGSITQLTHTGSATEPPAKRTCPTCKGNGFIEWFTGPSRHMETCSDCDGEGAIQDLHGEMDEELTT